jgi:hypothetical protein
MPTAVKGALVLSTKGDRISYRDKCDRCGTLGSGFHESIIQKNTTMRGSFAFVCFKCKKPQEVEIRGDSLR